MSLVKDIGDFLQEKQIGTVGTDIFCGTLPDKPDDAIALFQYAGRVPDTLSGIDRPGLQVRVRAGGYEQAICKIEQVENELRQVGDEYNDKLNGGVIINGSFYLRISPTQSAFSLGEDTKGRYEFVQNFNVNLRR